MEKKPESHYVDEWKVEPIAPYGSLEPKTPGDPKRRTNVCPAAAVEEMRGYVEQCANLDTWPEGECSKEWLMRMLGDIESGKVDEAKAHRWLGYIQGVLRARGTGTVKEYGEVNKRSKR